MKARVLLRKVHYWGSLFIFIQVGVIIGAGLLLMVKKDFDWIQPPTQRGSAPGEVPSMTTAALFEIARSIPEMQISEWDDLDRVDYKVGKGVIKFIAQNGIEIQIDTHNGEVLQIKQRRSDLIESIHDGSYFSDYIKYYVFFPAGFILLVLWATGIYLFLLPHLTKKKKSRQTRLQAKSPIPGINSGKTESSS